MSIRLGSVAACVLALAWAAHVAGPALAEQSLDGEPGYHLAYWYEVGGYHNQTCAPNCSGGGSSCTGTGNHSAYVHVWDSDGNKLGNIRIEGADNPNKFGITNNDPFDKLGFAEIPLFINDTPRFRVNDSGIATDIAPEMVENRSPANGHYSWELGFIRIPEGVNVSFDQVLIGTPNISGLPGELHAPTTTSCAFYDTDPLAWNSDDYCLDNSANSFGQTFVANGNRVVAAKFQPTVGFLQDLRYGVTIRENGPGGAIVGAQAESRDMKSDEYFTQIVRWPLLGTGAAEVVPGNTYYAEIVRTDLPQSINVWRRDNDTYPDGQMFRNGSPVSGTDLIGRIICATVDTTPPDPQIGRSPESIDRQVTIGRDLADDTFDVFNAGGQTLNYSITDNAAWLSVDPTSGSSNGEIDTITIDYATAGLALGNYDATITITDPAATNSPQTIAVGLEVVPVTYLGDCDGDDDTDQDDFGIFQACLTGPGIELTDPDCLCAKLDEDVDVDADDFAVFANCMSGADITPPAHCEK